MSDGVIIILGSRSAGKILAAAAKVDPDVPQTSRFLPTGSSTKRQILVIEAYSKHRFSPRLPSVGEIERRVEEQMRSARSGNVIGILFAYSNKLGEVTKLPFSQHSRFLGMEGQALFQRLIVVHPTDSVAMKEWSDLMDAGMRVTCFDGKTESAAQSIVRQLFDQPNAVSEAEETLSTPSHESSEVVASESFPLLYTESAHTTERHADQAVVLLVGHSGHGKSKTINRLIGQSLLKVGRGTAGSTTKEIQRVKIPVYSPDTKVTVTLAFDDTPGDADTYHNDRAANSRLIRIYKERYFPDITGSDGSTHGVPRRTYPNVILLVAAWNSITPDAHNDPTTFTSPLGKSMYNLQCSGLVDPNRTNVVVVVTKSMSSWDQFDDFERVDEKNTQWKIEAGIRRGIIADLQRRVFPKSAQWRIVFVENGGGSDMSTKYPTLPNGELSHQNLFEAIRSVIDSPGANGTTDLAGLHALDVLTGAQKVDLTSQATTEILVGKPVNSIMDPERLPKDCNVPSALHRIQELADCYLGVTYNPIWGHFGRNRVLSLDPSEILFSNGPGSQREQFTHVADAQQERMNVATRLLCDFDMPDVAGLSTHYSSASAVQSSWSSDSQLYTAQHITALVTLRPLRPQLSQEILDIIAGLPRWSEKSQRQYIDFFSGHGTHVLLRLALGGNLRVVVRNVQNTGGSTRGGGVQLEATVPALEGVVNVGTTFDHSRQHSTHISGGRREIDVFRDGGGTVSAELTYMLEKHFKQPPAGQNAECGWPNAEVRQKWVKALDADPTFCPDNEYTEYRWLHTLGGLTKEQESDLRTAAEFYLKMRHKKIVEDPAPAQVAKSGYLPREQNSRGIRQRFIQFFSPNKKK